MIWFLLAWVALQIASRYATEYSNHGLHIQIKGSPFAAAGDWEWFDWLPRYEVNQFDTQDEQQETVKFFTAWAIHGKVLFLRYAIKAVRFQYEMTWSENEELQKVAPVTTYDHEGKPKVMPRAEKAKAIQHAELRAKYCRPGRRVRVKR